MRRNAKADNVASKHRGERFDANAETARVDPATLSLRIDLYIQMRIGPGTIQLLEAIRTHRSISAAARAINNMSYRRAWMLVDDIDSIFGTRIVDLKVGGREGNGCLASLGLAVNECYRALERAAADAAQPHLAALQAEVERTKDDLECSKPQN